MVKDAQTRLAICNNGEDFAYYIRRGTGSGTTKWILHLKGGGSCKSIEECKKRGPSFTDPPSASTRKPGGIMTTNAEQNPQFYNWNHVYLYYCSSDLWTGDRAASTETAGLHFRGARIVTAVVEDLMNSELTPITTLDQASEIIFSGSSAGGGGVANNINRLVALLPEGTPIVGLVDSAFAPRVQPFIQYDEDYVVGTVNRITFWGAQVDPVCLAATSDPNVCLGAHSLMPYFQAGMFFYYDQADGNRLPKNRHYRSQRPRAAQVRAGGLRPGHARGSGDHHRRLFLDLRRQTHRGDQCPLFQSQSRRPELSRCLRELVSADGRSRESHRPGTSALAGQQGQVTPLAICKLAVVQALGVRYNERASIRIISEITRGWRSPCSSSDSSLWGAPQRGCC